MKTICLGCTLMLAMLTSSLVHAEPDIVSVDMRDRSENDAYYIVFLARPAQASTDNDDKSWTGHAFIGLGKDDSSAKACTSTSFGFYPAKGVGALGPVPGKIVEESHKSQQRTMLVVQVNSDTYDRIDKIRQEWSKKTDYRLIERDCITFTMEVAKACGVSVPKRDKFKLPWDYVKALADSNRVKNN